MRKILTAIMKAFIKICKIALFVIVVTFFITIFYPEGVIKAVEIFKGFVGG